MAKLTMQVTKLATFVLIILTPIIAVPVSQGHAIGSRDSKVAAGQQSCKARSRVLVINYSTHIRAAFSQEKCEAAVHHLKTNGGLPTAMKCYDDGDGATWLKFNNLPGQAELINKALHAAWERIGFNCPDY